MADCSGQRILTGVVAILSVLTVVLIGILIWRETRDDEKMEKTKITTETLKTYYPSSFRSEKDQLLYQQKYMEGFDNRTLVRNITKSLRGPCAFSCSQQGGEFGNVPSRRRRQSGPRGVFHGCCVSTVRFAFPKKKPNINGDERILLQLSDARQYFAVHQCNTVAQCTGCTCYQENNLHSAVVLKTHIDKVGDAEYIEDTETDLFYFDGCCKCINN